MKYIVVLGDGMADYPVEALGGKTPLEVAKKPNIDYMCAHGELGLVNTVPESLPPGSDVANLSAFGYDPFKYYSGRSPLEAVSMGIDIKDTDIIFRCNVVTVSDEENYLDKRIIDHSADEITTEAARELMKAVAEAFDIVMHLCGIRDLIILISHLPTTFLRKILQNIFLKAREQIYLQI